MLIRLREGAQTQVWAVYDTRDVVKELDGATESQAEAALRDLVLRGQTEERGVPRHPSVEYVVEGGRDGLDSDPWQNMYMRNEDEEELLAHKSD